MTRNASRIPQVRQQAGREERVGFRACFAYWPLFAFSAPASLMSAGRNLTIWELLVFRE